jgi:hypothetical protein
MIEISDESMTLAVDRRDRRDCSLQPARSSGRQGCVDRLHPPRAIDGAITALTLAERLAAGYGDSDPFVKSWRPELFL